MYPFAAGWVWTEDPSAPAPSAPSMMPLLGVGVWFWAVILRSWTLGVFALLPAEIQKYSGKA